MEKVVNLHELEVEVHHNDKLIFIKAEKIPREINE